MRFRGWTVRARLVTACLVVELLVLCASMVDSLAVLQDQQRAQAQHQSRQIAALLGQSIAAPLAQRDYAAVQQLLDALLQEGTVAYLDLVDHRGKPVARAGWPVDRPLPPRDDGRFDLDCEDGLVHWSADVTVAGQGLGRLDMGLPTGPMRQARQALVVRGAAFGGVALVVSALVMAGAGLALTRGLARLSAASLRVASGQYDTQVPVLGNDELGQLARSFNTMSTRVHEREQALQRHLSRVREERSRLGTLLDALHSGIVMLNARGGVAYVNRAFLQMWGLPAVDIGTPVELLVAHMRRRAPEAAQQALAAWLPGSTGNEPAEGAAVEFELAGGRCIQQRRQLLPGEAGGCIWFQRDVTQEREMAQQAAQARTDPLTGLLNRRGFEAGLAAWMVSGQPLALITLDLDDFKQANDRGGHQLGDRVLVAVAQVLRDHGGLAARLGGDEFALCLCGPDALAAEATAAQLVRSICALRFEAKGEYLGVGASVGVARLRPDQDGTSTTPDTAGLLDKADRAMYGAKRRGKNQWAQHPPTEPAPLVP